MSEKAVRYTIKRFKEHGTVHDLKRSGHPNNISSKHVAEMKKLMLKDILWSTEDCMQYMKECHGISVCDATMRTSLEKHCCYSYILQRKPALGEESREARVLRSHEFIHYTRRQLRLVIFSDEKTFSQDATGAKLRRWLPVGHPFDEKRMLPSHLFGGVQVHF